MLSALRTPAASSRCIPHFTHRPRSRGYASITDLSRYPSPGERLHGFTLQRTKHVPELELTALHFQHDKTGADYLHVAREDKNNVFSIGFKTNPPDATGVPHILEHTTLCGSERYPVRDPFFRMLPRSLSNFMNAFTSADHTTYPFATTNAQDFKNLMSVYMDATLHPLLKQHDFVQEGWRLGSENPTQDAQDLVFKGVVYNEMKGQMSDASYLYYIRFMEHIFPAINNSGGDPKNMTNLTYEQLRDFHAEHYHPSNAKVLTYGDMPLMEHLSEIGSRLDAFSKISPSNDIKEPIPLESGPSYVTVPGPVDPLTPKDAQYKTSTSWLMGNTTDLQESFALRIASSLLVDGYGSPLYCALIEAGLGSDFTPNTGYDTAATKGILSVGLNGVSKENVSKVKEAIAATIAEVADKGFEKSKVDGILHQLELSLKHKTASFGMGLVQRLKPGWFNGIDPFEALAWNSIVDGFKTEYAKGGYLEGLIKKYLANDNTLTFTMEPSEVYAKNLVAEEAARLQSKISEAVSQFPSEEEAHKQLKQRELELLEEQEKGSTQDTSCLPTVYVKDILRKQTPTTVRDSTVGNTEVQWRETPTNGLTYFRALSLFKDLPEELRMLVPLFCDSLMRIGTKTKSMAELEDLIKLKTGGISFGYHASPSARDILACEEGFSLSGYALDRNIPAMYELLRTVLLETDFDSPKAYGMIRQLLQSSASGAVDAIAESGHSYARRLAEAGLTPHGRLVEQTAGLSQVKMITNLASQPEADATVMNELLGKLRQIQSTAVANMSNMRVALTCGQDAAAENEKQLQAFLESTKPFGVASTTMRRSSPMQSYPSNSKTFVNLPFQVSYSGLSLPTAPYTDLSGAPLAILAQLLTHKHLHHEIREKGGAYGGGAYSRGLGGVFGMYSYRDPNPENTLRIMRDAGRWAHERDFSAQELEEAKLSVFQSVDAPQSVSEEGMTRFLHGVEPEMEQARRELLLDVTKEQVREVAERFLVKGVPEGNLVVLGERKGFVKEKDGWRVEDMGMAAAAGGPETAKAVAAAA